MSDMSPHPNRVHLGTFKPGKPYTDMTDDEKRAFRGQVIDALRRRTNVARAAVGEAPVPEPEQG